MKARISNETSGYTYLKDEHEKEKKQNINVDVEHHQLTDLSLLSISSSRAWTSTSQPWKVTIVGRKGCSTWYFGRFLVVEK
jgi:hypothetical protein